MKKSSEGKDSNYFITQVMKNTPPVPISKSPTMLVPISYGENSPNSLFSPTGIHGCEDFKKFRSVKKLNTGDEENAEQQLEEKVEDDTEESENFGKVDTRKKMNLIYEFDVKTLIPSVYNSTQFNPLLFMARLPKHAPCVTGFCIPKKQKTCEKITLVLDLDETLVHCSTESFGSKTYDFEFPVVYNSVTYNIFVRKRPYLEEFLDFVSKEFEVVVFTASHESYAGTLLDLLDPKEQYFKKTHRVYRESCIRVLGNYIKDLSILGRDIKRCVIIDNSPSAFGYHIENGIPIISWYDDFSDYELLRVASFLKNLVDVDDVRGTIEGKFGIGNLVKQYKMKIKHLEERIKNV